MKKTRHYTKHQAFNTVYKKLKQNSKAKTAGYEAPKKYHHAPEKLDIFTHYRDYIRWSNELHAHSTRLISILRSLYNKSKGATSSWCESKSKLNNILREFDILILDIEDLYDDIFEFQNCMLATDINQKHAEIEALSDQVRYLSTLESKITETCNRKLYEISSSRLTHANLLIASVALLVAFLSLYYS